MRTSFLLAVIGALMLTASDSARMQESVTLTTPVSIGTRSSWQVQSLYIVVLPQPYVRIEVRDNLANVVVDEHTDKTAVTAATLLAALNTANLTSNSLLKRITTHLQSEGKIGAGSVTGSPQ